MHVQWRVSALRTETKGWNRKRINSHLGGSGPGATGIGCNSKSDGIRARICARACWLPGLKRSVFLLNVPVPLLYAARRDAAAICELERATDASRSYRERSHRYRTHRYQPGRG